MAANAPAVRIVYVTVEAVPTFTVTVLGVSAMGLEVCSTLIFCPLVILEVLAFRTPSTYSLALAGVRVIGALEPRPVTVNSLLCSVVLGAVVRTGVKLGGLN